jgi:fucose permease
MIRPGRKLSKLERSLAIVLALIWMAAGCAALYAAALRSQWGFCFLALLAIAYGLAWTRVAVRSRLLTWPSLFAPWRAGNP